MDISLPQEGLIHQLLCQICKNPENQLFLCQSCANRFLQASDEFKKLTKVQIETGFGRIAAVIQKIDQKKFNTVASLEGSVLSNLKEIGFVKASLQKKESMIAVLTEKRKMVRENIDKLKEVIRQRKVDLIEIKSKLSNSSEEEKNLKKITKLKHAAAGFLLEYCKLDNRNLILFPAFNPKKYFHFSEYIISDVKHTTNIPGKKNAAQSFDEIDNVLSNRRVSVDMNKLIIENNDYKSIRIKTSLPTKEYDSLNMYIYKLAFCMNKLSTFLDVCLPHEVDDSKMTIKNHLSDKY